ncbi:MAG: sortase [Parcubacteria group bacterium]
MRRLNSILEVIVILLGIYLIASPFYPEISLRWSKWQDDTQGYKYNSNLAQAAGVEIQQNPPQTNTLLIPKIEVDTPILEGASSDTLNKGIWRRPLSSQPGRLGNTVLTAHRYLYSAGPNTFFHLNKLAVGDRFAIFWEGREYDYQIFNIKEVSADAVEIEAPTQTEIVTLYTCAPLWSAKNRLVIMAQPFSNTKAL